MRIGRLVFPWHIGGRILVPIAADQHFHALALQAVNPRSQEPRFLFTHPAGIVSGIMGIAYRQQPPSGKRNVAANRHRFRLNRLTGKGKRDG